MDVPPAAGAPGPGVPAGTPPERFGGPPPARTTAADVAHRLEVVEARLADLSARLDTLGTSVPAAVRDAVATEVGAVSGELRRTVSELGRLLVRDLGKLSQILAEHRDTIVEEIRAPSPASVPVPEPPAAPVGPREVQTSPAPAPDVAGGVEAEVADADSLGGGDGGAEAADEGDEGDEADEGDEGEGRSWRRRRRAR